MFMYCPKCGKEIKSDKTPEFCIHCGCRISDYDNSPDRLMLYNPVPEDDETVNKDMIDDDDIPEYQYHDFRKRKSGFVRVILIILVLCFLTAPVISIFYGNRGDTLLSESASALKTAEAYRAVLENGGEITSDMLAEMEIRDAVDIALMSIDADVIETETYGGEVYVYIRGEEIMNTMITLDKMRSDGMTFLELMRKHEDVKEIVYYVYMEFELSDGETEISPVMAYAVSGDTIRDTDFTYAYSDDIEDYVDDYWHSQIFDYGY